MVRGNAHHRTQPQDETIITGYQPDPRYAHHTVVISKPLLVLNKVHLDLLCAARQAQHRGLPLELDLTAPDVPTCLHQLHEHFLLNPANNLITDRGITALRVAGLR